MTEHTGNLIARRDALMAEARTLLATVDDYTKRVAAYDRDVNETFEPWGGLEGGAFDYFNGPFSALIALGDVPSEYTGCRGDGLATFERADQPQRHLRSAWPCTPTSAPAPVGALTYAAGARWTEPRTPRSRSNGSRWISAHRTR